MRYKVYADGACSNNGRANANGGWAYVVLDEQDNLVVANSGSEADTTNQRMEIMALIKALEFMHGIQTGFFICELHSDSAYCVNAVNDKWIVNWRRNGWRTSARQPVKNQALWEHLYDLYADDGRFTFIKVKGHSGNKWNDHVDQLAQEAKNAIRT